MSAACSSVTGRLVEEKQKQVEQMQKQVKQLQEELYRSEIGNNNNNTDSF